MATDGEIIAFETLYKEQYPKLYYYARTLVGENDAEDVVAEVFMDLWRRRRETDMGPSVGGMLFKAVYTRSLNCLRHRNVTASRVALIEEIVLRQADARDPHYASSPLANAENADLRRRIDEAIERLPQRCRDVFRLSYMQDLSNSKIASVLGLSVRTVESHIYHALNTLRSILHKD